MVLVHIFTEYTFEFVTQNCSTTHQSSTFLLNDLTFSFYNMSSTNSVITMVFTKKTRRAIYNLPKEIYFLIST